MLPDTKLAIAQLILLVFIAALAHALVRGRFWLTCVGVSIVGNAVVTFFVAPIFLGTVSNIWPIACCSWILPGILVAAVVGAPFAMLRRPPVLEGHCVSCGYDLRGNVSGRCPECGTPVPPSGSG